MPRLRVLVALATFVLTGALWALPGHGPLLPGRHPAEAQQSLTVAAPVATATGADIVVTWTGGGSFAWSAAYSDGTGGQQATNSSPLTIRMPYHVSGAAADGWLCVAASCAAYTVPAKPTASTVHLFGYREPTTNADATLTPLTDLATIRVYYRCGSGAEAMAEFPASSPTGGASRDQSIAVPCTSGTITMQATAVDVGGLESSRSGVASKVIGSTKPLPAGPGTLQLTR